MAMVIGLIYLMMLLYMREFCITDKGGNYIEDIDEATNYSLEEY